MHFKKHPFLNLILLSGIFLFLSSGFAAAQTATPEGTQTATDSLKNKIIPAEFPGGNQNFQVWLQEHLKYPDVPDSKVKNGTVIVQFYIDRQGKARGFMVIKSLSRPYNKAAMKTLKQMPSWIPSQRNGRNIDYWVLLPINFALKSSKQQP